MWSLGPCYSKIPLSYTIAFLIRPHASATPLNITQLPFPLPLRLQYVPRVPKPWRRPCVHPAIGSRGSRYHSLSPPPHFANSTPDEILRAPVRVLPRSRCSGRPCCLDSHEIALGTEDVIVCMQHATRKRNGVGCRHDILGAPSIVYPAPLRLLGQISA